MFLHQSFFLYSVFLSQMNAVGMNLAPVYLRTSTRFGIIRDMTEQQRTLQYENILLVKLNWMKIACSSRQVITKIMQNHSREISLTINSLQNCIELFPIYSSSNQMRMSNFKNWPLWRLFMLLRSRILDFF